VLDTPELIDRLWDVLKVGGGNLHELA
jgi:hypothetical protein